MARYILTRLLQAVFVLWAAFTVSFILLQALPGDEILIKFENPDLGLSKQQIADIRLAYGADVPLHQQYLFSLGRVLSGQLGNSIQRGVPVIDAIAANLPSTLRLTVLGFVTAAFTNFNLVALGVIGAVMAILYIQLSPKYNRVAGAPAQAAGNNDLDNELD
ncbi:MAG: hypothetical protein E6766_08800 [Enterobacter sp.]|nr:hypothetical protein [Enterobacter sp.]MDU1920457.1 hypothetical protein [Enterobacter sp.]